MTDLYYEYHGCGEGFTIFEEDEQLGIMCELEGGFSTDILNLSKVLEENSEVRKAFKKHIEEIERRLYG